LFTLNLVWTNNNLNLKRMRYIIFISLITLVYTIKAQTYQNHHHFEAKNSSVVITKHVELSNGNTLQSMIVNDSLALYPGGQLCYAESVVKNPGSVLTLTDANNTQLWSRQWFPVNYLNDFFYIETFFVDAFGNIYLSGRFSGKVDLDPGAGTDTFNTVFQNAGYGFLIKLDNNGNYQWSKILTNPSNASQFCNIYSLVPMNNGNLLCAGVFSGTVDFDPGTGVQTLTTPGNGNNAFFLELDLAGNFVNVVTLSSNGSSSPGHAVIDNVGNIYVVLSFSGTVDIDPTAGITNYTSYEYYYNSCLVKYDSVFNLIWSKHFDPDFGFPLLDRLDDQNLYLITNFVDTAILNNNTNVIAQGFADLAIERWDTAGNCLWSKTFTGPGDIYSSDFKIINNSLNLLYFYDDTLHTNTGTNDTTIYATNYDIAYSVLDLNGDHIETLELKSDSSTYNYYGKLDFSLNSTNFNYFTTGIIDLDPYPAVVNDSPQSAWNEGISGVVELIPILTGVVPTNNNSKQAMVAYPNPANEYINVESTSEGMVTVCDIFGKTLFLERVFAEQIVRINTTSFPQGLYFLKLENKSGKNSSVQKVIVNHE